MVKHRHHECFPQCTFHEDDIVLVTPPRILVKMDIVKPNTVWHVKKASSMISVKLLDSGSNERDHEASRS